MSNNKKCLFIFRRDLRLTDNTGLIEAGKRYETIIPCFIVDPRQVQAHPFRSLPAAGTPPVFPLERGTLVPPLGGH